MNTYRHMSDDELYRTIKSVKALRYNASQMRNASQFGRLDRQLEDMYREQDRRRRVNR